MFFLVPTIDVEGVHGHRPFDELVLGDVGGGETWGVYKIAELLRRYGCAGTFFVDVYEYTLWGERPVAEVCKRLIDLGQDVQLHTHPSWRDDERDPQWLRNLKRKKSYLRQNKDFMTKLTVSEQVAVLEHGMELMTRWLGSPPVAHRSGGYSINEATIEALREVGIPLDSSMNASHENTKLYWSKNAIVKNNGITEVPVTQGLLALDIASGARRKTLFSKEKKTDLDLYDFRQLQSYVDGALELDVRLCNLFMHSYSLLDLTRGFTRARPDEKQLKKLCHILDYGKSNSYINIVTCRDIVNWSSKQDDGLYGEDLVPRVPLSLSAGGSHIYRKTKKMIGNRLW